MIRLKCAKEAMHLLEGWDETFVKTCLEGRIGSVWSTKDRDHTSVMLTVGEFIMFAGEPDEALVSFVPDGYATNFAIAMVKDDDERWFSLIEKIYGSNARRCTRYAVKKEGIDSFDKDRLDALAVLPDGYTIRKIDRELYDYCRSDEEFFDFVSQYPTFDDYDEHGLGFIIMHGDEKAAGVSSFSDYDGGIEIEIETKPQHRRRGLAACGAAHFILECIKRGVYPSWDAANLSSLALAEKLGYHFDREYTVYEIENYNK